MFENEGFHWRDNIYFKRLQDGSVRIAFGEVRWPSEMDQGVPSERDTVEPKGEIVKELIIPAMEWDSIVLFVSKPQP
jgi:hypothetical protein